MSVEIITLTNRLPKPEEIHRRIESCQEELSALRKLLRASINAHKADEARQQRQRPEVLAHA